MKGQMHKPLNHQAHDNEVSKRATLKNLAQARVRGPRDNGDGHTNEHSGHLDHMIVDLDDSPGGSPYKTKNDIQESKRMELVQLLNQRLADAVDLQLQMKQAHWNVKGPSFIALHELFDRISEDAESYVDTLAERVVQLGGIALGTVRISGAASRLEEYPLNVAEGPAHIGAVSSALADFGKEVRRSIAEADQLDDAGTADIFTEISRGTDKWLWFVEAHAQAAR
ncbi:MAG TPA: DNA starvation/stationary phase protection protein Dps [Bacteroidota bacterium]|jgi:starvation-inducible DNA-binding protein|nr:DNA starvation/stationary phase protection protein Dps [Bacteroidota bacterium]